MDFSAYTNKGVYLFAFFSLFIIESLAANPAIKNDHNQPSLLNEEKIRLAIQKKHDGRIVSVVKIASPRFPNCHLVKISDRREGFKLIRHACK